MLPSNQLLVIKSQTNTFWLVTKYYVFEEVDYARTI